jgi:formamidopyrimidine-DNA glycosylase
LFHDMRRLGTLVLHDDLAAAGSWVIDPVATAFSSALLGQLVHRCRQEIKPWLLRQDRLVGIGNIYASEILFDARVDPRRRAGSLTASELRRLHAATKRILSRAIRYSGTTFSNFQNVRGLSGGYQRYLAVYGKEGEACPRCGRQIQRLVQQQRSTFFCPHCQRNPKQPVHGV